MAHHGTHPPLDRPTLHERTTREHDHDCQDRAADLFAYIEGYYNRAPIHSAIGYITPQQAEEKAA
jgi:hypothetical protein